MRTRPRRRPSECGKKKGSVTRTAQLYVHKISCPGSILRGTSANTGEYNSMEKITDKPEIKTCIQVAQCGIREPSQTQRRNHQTKTPNVNKCLLLKFNVRCNTPRLPMKRNSRIFCVFVFDFCVSFWALLFSFVLFWSDCLFVCFSKSICLRLHINVFQIPPERMDGESRNKRLLLSRSEHLKL